MTRHQSPEARRAQILCAARARFISEGYASTRMADIAHDAGLSKGGVYFHFSSKRELFDALVEDEFNEAIRFFKGINAGADTLLEKLAGVSSYYLRFFSTQNELGRFRVIVGEMALREADIHASVLELNRAYLRVLSGLLAGGVEDGDLRSDLDVNATAIIIKSLLDGLQETLSFDPELNGNLQSIIIAGMRMILSGIAQPGGEVAEQLSALL